ncbi:MAG: carboxypeptidase-like regulatory domain-containing protein, partial [Chitinophagaceae bacterium]
MNRPHILLSLIVLLFSSLGFAQKKPAYVSGKVIDENEQPLSNVSVVILGRQAGVSTNDTGYFRLKVPADKAVALVFSYTGHREEQRNFLLNEDEEEFVTIRLDRGEGTVLTEVIVSDQRDRSEASLIRLNPKTVINLPAPVGGVESLIKIFVGSNNELTSQYSVRGGSYDENLVYVNDFEIFRPYL